MRTFQHQSVTKSRKRRRCDWCGEMIDIGQPYDSYRFVTCGNAGTVRMHPECLEPSSEMAKQEGGWFEWDLGEFKRGSTEANATTGQRRLVCERCGDSGLQPAGCWAGKAYDSLAGRCELCAEPSSNP